MLYATNRFPGDGSTTTYEFNFVGGYLDPEHVKAFVEDPTGTVLTPVAIQPSQWLGPNTLTGFSPVPVGSVMVLRRDTPKLPMVDFSNGARVTERSLDIAARQGLFVAMEQSDVAGTDGGGGGVPIPTSLLSVGAGASLIQDKLLDTYYIRSIVGTGSVTVSVVGNTIVINGSDTPVGGSGDVTGPLSSVNGELSAFVGTSGKSINGSGLTAATITASIAAKQNTLVSGANIKTINGQSVVGSGDLVISGGGGGSGDVVGPASSVNGELPVFSGLTGKVIAASGTTLSSINSNISAKQAILVSGTNIKTVNGTSLLGSGDVAITGGTTAKTRIVVLGDSLTAQTALLAEAWPAILERSLVAGGIDVEVHNLAVVGWDFYNTLTVPAFGIKTPVEKAISLNPAVVIVALGANDNITGTPRTIGQVKADAAAVFSGLRTGLPTATLIYGSELTWDKVHNPSGTGVLNQQVGPYMMEKPASGILANSYSSEMLANGVGATMNSRIARWVEMDTYIKGLGTIDGSYTVDHYMANRLGLIGVDGIHPTVEGAHFFAGCARTAFTGIPALAAKFPELRVTNYPSWDTPDSMRALFLTSSGGYWQDVAESAGGQYVSAQRSLVKGVRPRSWFLPSRGALQTGDLTVISGGILTWSVNNGKPNTAVELSINGAAFAATPFISDSMGNVTVVQPHAHVLTGSLDCRVRMGDEILGPVTFTVAAYPPAPGNVVGPASSVANRLAVFSGTTGKIIADGGQTLAQVDASIATKQATLVSGTNIKTVGGVSVLGAGNIPVPAAPVVSGGSLTTGSITSVDTTIGGFTAPQSGMLLLQWSIGGTAGVGGTALLTRSTLNGVALSTGSSVVGLASSAYATVCGSAIATVAAGDYVALLASTVGTFNSSTTNNTHFYRYTIL